MEQKKKVLFVATVVKTHINTFHLSFLKMFKEYGWEVHVAAKNDFVDEPCVIPNCDRHFDIDFARSPFSKSNIKAYKQLKQIIETKHYDIIHCHTPVAGVLTRLAARNVKGTTVIYTAHGFHFYKGAPLINWLIYYPVEHFCAKLTDKLITINQEDYNRAKSWSLRNNGKVYYVPGVGVDIEKIRSISINKEQKKNELGIPNDVKVLLSVGELNENKNHEIIIKTLSKLDNKDFVYLICGKGELKGYLQNLAQEIGIGDKVKFLGYRMDVLEICKIADLFIFPSKREGLPVSLIEAMACGVPCIASDVRGNRDLLSNDNLCKSNNEEEWKMLIEVFLDKKTKVIEPVVKYQLETIKAQMMKIYAI
ncbi:glycosyltransferase family 4 protein [Phascolarctobacterium faecium]|jgi:yveN, capsular polysaccharide biosynthesis protein, glycosyl transferase family 4|uniref:glycosyltransferase family 4 protein n=1 Tax=Phascolarctobacterium faecium TaxID=33025 RepID=UPI001FCB6085|nr:glycosyltransferase family 4 protein [Phascolarctobacterium faecium]